MSASFRSVILFCLVGVLAACSSGPAAGGEGTSSTVPVSGQAATQASTAAPAAAAAQAAPTQAASPTQADYSLHHAIFTGDLAGIRNALEAGADPGKPLQGLLESNGRKTPVTIYAFSGVIESPALAAADKVTVLRWFRLKGARFDTLSAIGTSLLVQALDTTPPDQVLAMARVLIDGGADPRKGNQAEYTRATTAPDGTRTESRGRWDRSPVIAVEQRNDLGLETRLALWAELARAGDDVNRKDSSGRPLWQMVVEKDPRETWLPAIEALLKAGMDPNLRGAFVYHSVLSVNGEVTQSQGVVETPLLHACLYPGGYQVWSPGKEFTREQRQKTIALLSRWKADFNLEDSTHRTPLETALGLLGTRPLELDEAYRALTEGGADPNRFHEGGTPLGDLLSTKDVPNLESYALSAFGRLKDLDAPVMRYSHSPALYGAVSAGRAALVKWLLDHGANPDVRNADGKTPIMGMGNFLFWSDDARMDAETLKKGREIVDLFIARKADLRAVDKNGYSIVTMLSNNDHNLELVRVLVAAGADYKAVNTEDTTPLGMAVRLGAREIASFLRAQGAKDLHGPPVPAGNATALAKAVLNGSATDLAGFSREDFSRISVRLSSGLPAAALHLAVEKGDPRTLAALLARGAAVDSPDSAGRTPLGQAVIAGRSDLASILLDAGADPNFADNSGDSPYSWAMALHPELLAAFTTRSVRPTGKALAYRALYTGALPALKSLGDLVSPTQELITAAADLGRPQILDYWLAKAPQADAKPGDLRAQAQKVAALLSSYPGGQATAEPIPRIHDGLEKKKGDFPYVLPEWSPWLASAVKPAPKLANYPVYVSMPERLDPPQGWGLLISMLKPLSKDQYPSAAFRAVLKAHRLVWVGFDPYFGNPGIDPAFNGDSIESMAVSHESYILAIVRAVLARLPLDRSRVYLAGFSWGGRLTGEITPKYPELFAGGIAVGGCFTTGGRSLFGPSMDAARRSQRMVFATGDYDYNRKETWNGYSAYLAMGYPSLYLQEPLGEHAGLTAASFDKALAFIDPLGR